MAKKKSALNKSKAIRNYLATHKRAMPAEVVQALGKKGIKITPQQVSMVRYQSRNTKKKRSRKVAGRATSNSEATLKLSDLIAAKQFAEKVGGISSAQATLNALQKLGG